MPETCIVCTLRPCSVRLGCGHLFACPECARQCETCAICRKPITVRFHVQAFGEISSTAAASTDRSAAEVTSVQHTDLVAQETVAEVAESEKHARSSESSSDSDRLTFRDLDREFAECAGCHEMRAAWRFECPELCPNTDMVCTPCARTWACLICKHPASWQDMRLDSPASSEASPVSSRSDKSLVVHIHTPRSNVSTDPDDDSDACRGQDEPLQSWPSWHPGSASQPSGDQTMKSSNPSTEGTWHETEAAQQLVEHCKNQNSIVELTNDVAISKCALAFQVCLVKLTEWKDQCKDRALILAPTCPIVRQYLDCSRMAYKDLSVCAVIGSVEVDGWGKEEWNRTVVNHNVLLTTPQLFLEALQSRFTDLDSFCLLVIDSCKHCLGKHPFATILSTYVGEHEIRVLGLSENLIKRKIKGEEERKVAEKSLEQAMQSKIWRPRESSLAADRARQ